MPNNDLAIRFTEEMYATKQDVSHELKMSIIDNFWTLILKYRENFAHYLSLRSIDKNSLKIILCQSLNLKASASEGNLLRLMGEYMRTKSDENELANVKQDSLVQSLKVIAQINNISINNAVLLALASDSYVKNVDEQRAPLANYLKAIKFLNEHIGSTIDANLSLSLLRIVSGNEFITLYRTVEDDNYRNRILIDRIYTCAPVAVIEPLMSSLFNFISVSNLSFSLKAILVYYYIMYLKPFPAKNEEMAILLAKLTLANSSLGEFAFYLPLEKLITENHDKVTKIFAEVQKTSDTTYFVNYALDIIDESAKDYADAQINRHVSEVKKDFYQEEQAIDVSSPTNKKTISLFSEEELEQIEEKPVIHRNESVHEVEKPKAEPVEVEEKPDENEEIEIIEKKEIAVEKIPPSLDERQANRLEEHLLELNPLMKPGEAHFYARHCTLGMNYTIAQYKRSIGCVYETARTSMEHLVEMGYYRKGKIKNKFVYIPIKQEN